MVEVDVKGKIAEKEADLQSLAQRLQSMEQQMQNLQQQRQTLINEAVKAQGALDVLRSLDGTQPAEKAAKGKTPK